jgi:hypothetical protein
MRRRSGGHGEEVDGDQIPDMVSEEGAPGLRGLGAARRHEAGDGAFRNLDAKLQELSVNARGAPREDSRQPSS